MGEFVECGDSSPNGSESGDESPHSTLGGLNDDQCRVLPFAFEFVYPLTIVP